MKSVVSFSLSVLKAQKISVLLTASIIGLGTTGFLSIRLLTERIESSVFAGARDSLGGDLALTLTRPIPQEEAEGLVAVARTFPGAEGMRYTRISEGLSMASRPAKPLDLKSSPVPFGGTTLVEVIAVANNFPLLSGPVTSPPKALLELTDTEALIDASLAEQIYGGTDQALGSSVTIGALTFTVAGLILEDPAREPRSLVTGPRVYIRRSSMVLESLFTDRSRVRDTILLAFDSTSSVPTHGAKNVASRGSDAADTEALAEALEQKAQSSPVEGLRVRTASEHAHRLFRPLKRFTSVVELTSLAALLVSLFGAAFSIRHLVRLLGPQVALLRALGASHRSATLPVWVVTGLALIGGLTLGTILAQTFGLNALSALFEETVSLGGQATSAGSPLTRSTMLAETSGRNDSIVSTLSTAGAVWILTIVVVLAALWPALRRALSLPPLRVLEDASVLTEADPTPKNTLVRDNANPKPGFTQWHKQGALQALERGFLPTMAIAGSILWIIGDLQTALISSGALAALLLALYLITRVFFAICAYLVNRFAPEVQVSLLSALRNRSQYQHFVVTLGFALTLAFFVGLLSGGFLGPLESSTDTDRPNMFFLDIQSSQKEEFENALSARFGVQFQSAPVVRARISAINNTPVTELLEEYKGGGEPRRGRKERAEDEDGDDRRRFLQREQNLSYTWALEAETIASGTPWPTKDPSNTQIEERPEVSLEERFARRLNVKLGDAITFSVQGVNLTAHVTSIRTVRWESGQINFFAVLHPSLLLNAPQQHIFAAHIPAQSQDVNDTNILPELTAWLRQNFPNVTFIDVRSVAAKVAAVIQKMVSAVQLISALCLATALIIFAITLLHLRTYRARDVALMRLLGGRSSAIKRGWASEYGVIGLISTLSALILALLLILSWNLYAFDEWPRIRLLEPLILGAAAVGLSVLLGVVASKNLMRRSPLDALRNAEEIGL
jgi:putative ABC transport system permease protein